MEMEEADKLLESYGWIMECWSPFEIRQKYGSSFASGTAADIVLDAIVESEKIKAKRNKKRRQQRKKKG